MFKVDGNDAKITVVIATATAPIEFFIQSVLSLILRTPKAVLDQIIISINGPDCRTGDPSTQDQSEKFAKELADYGYPITVVRTWSRTDASRAFQMCLPLVKTRYYLFMQDDIILLNKNWHEEAFNCNCEWVILTSVPKLIRKIEPHSPNDYLNVVDFYQLNTAFVLVDGIVCNNHWFSYDIQTSVKINKEFIEYNIDEFNITYGTQVESVRRNLPEDGKTYNLFGMPMGTWVYYYAKEGIRNFRPKTIYHFCEASTKENSYIDANAPSCELKYLEDEIWGNENIKDIYIKFLPTRKRIQIPEIYKVERGGNNQFPLILICVCVYKKIYHVEKWVKKWYDSFNQYNSKIALIHNFDGDEPNVNDKNRLLELKPDYYVPRFNRGYGTGVIQDIFERRLDYFKPDYDIFIYFTDDSYPLHKNFLGFVIKAMEQERVGMASLFMFPDCVRSTGFAIKRECAEKLIFTGDPVITILHGMKMEGQLSVQIARNMNFKIVQLPHINGKPIACDADYDGTANDELIGKDY